MALSSFHEGKVGDVARMKLGSEGLVVSAQGLGCMGMSAIYGPPKDEDEMIHLIHHAFASGITHFDTSDMYGPFTNEILLGKALKGVPREKVQVATKFGTIYNPITLSITGRGDPAYVRASCEGSLKRLGVDYIDLYYIHRIDTTVPIEVTIGELKKLVEEGKLKYLGLSEASAATIRRAHAVHPISAVQLEWSLWSREAEDEIVPTCRELGIGIVPYSPLGRGFLSQGSKILQDLADDDYRKVGQPRFQGDNLERNRVLFEKLRELANIKGCSPGQLALAWVHHKGDDVCPIPGTTKVKNLQENIGALKIKLNKEEIEEIESLFPRDAFAGSRYLEGQATFQTGGDTPPLASWKENTI